MASLAKSNNGQNHDRLDPPHDSLTMPSVLPIQGNASSGNDPLEITAFQRMLSATTGSLLTGLTMTPLDVVRVRWQSQTVKQQQPSTTPDFQKLMVKTPNAFRPANIGVTACCREVFFMNNNAEVCVAGPQVGGPSVECAMEQTRKSTFNSTLDGMRKIARNEGIFTLWRGLSPTLAMAIPGNMIYFTGYEWLRYSRESPFAMVKDDYVPLVAGSSARVIAAAVVSPIELFRTRLMASHGDTATSHVKDTLRSIQDMVAASGYRSLWRGLSLTLWRDVPFSGMYWWGYETIRGRLTDARERRRGGGLEVGSARGRARRLSQSQENHRDTFTDSFAAGALSGAFACIATMPFDVGKTRTQVYHDSARAAATAGAEKAAAAAAPEEQNMVRLLLHIMRTEGLPGLFRGWIPRVMKVAPACAIMISSFEMGKKVFRGVNERALEKERTAEKHDG